MERVQQVYKVMLLDETYLLSTEDFEQFQKECREIAGYGEPIFYPVPTYETGIEQMEQALEKDEVQPPLVYENHPPIAKVVAEPIKVHNEKLNDLINTMPKTAKIVKDTKIQKYVDMHEAGKDMLAIKNSMIKDKVCAESSIPYFVKKILEASTRVTKIELESAVETPDQTIERLKAENKSKVKDRQKPRLAVK